MHLWSESILGKKILKVKLLNLQFRRSFTHKVPFILSFWWRSVSLFQNRLSFALCRIPSPHHHPISSGISHFLGLSQDGHTVAFTELHMCQFGEEPRDRIKDKARRKSSSWHMCECLEFCWGWREVRGKDWRLGVMEHWSHLYGNHLGYFYPWHTPASEPRLVSMANWCGGPKQPS